MADAPRHDLELPGCTPEPLMAYLKALGILRLVSEQKDPEARGWWRNDTFWLRSTLDRDALVKFFLEEYKPTPIVVPWSGGDFFAVNWSPNHPKHAKTPTSSRVIEAILATETDRFAPYRRVLQAVNAALRRCAIERKEKMGKLKWDLIRELRSSCDEPQVIEWIDAAAVDTVERFAALLGSGGGSDGNTHFSDNFMQNLWDVLPDFNPQRSSPREDAACRAGLRTSLFGEFSTFRIEKRTSSLFDSGAVGGPNATQGMERVSLSNPWDVILALEGTINFAGAATKRLAANAVSEGAFPFEVSASVTVEDGLADKERAGAEVWLPLWVRPARCAEVLALLREGRALCGPRLARTGVDMARSIATLGVDRGINAFYRYAILKGRVGGDNYNTAASLGRFAVNERPDADLLREIDPWLERFRRAAGDKNAPPRFTAALRAIDSAIFDFCKYGGAVFFQKIVIALGAAERELASGERFREEKKLNPLAGLSAAWIEAARPQGQDFSPAWEFEIALALAGVRAADGEQGKVGPLRANLEPVSSWYDASDRRTKAKWVEKDRCVVWNAADLPTNLASVLARRMMDADRKGCENLPLASVATTSLDAVAAFIAGELDDRRIEDLLWGLMLIDIGRGRSAHDRAGVGGGAEDGIALPRAYALLKLLFLPRPLVFERAADGELDARLLRPHETGGVAVRPDPVILHLLRAGRLGQACQVAMRRLRASGLDPMPRPIRGRRVRDDDWGELDSMGGSRMDRLRLAASLLIPIDDVSVNRIARLAIAGDDLEEAQDAELTLAAKGELE